MILLGNALVTTFGFSENEYKNTWDICRVHQICTKKTTWIKQGNKGISTGTRNGNTSSTAETRKSVWAIRQSSTSNCKKTKTNIWGLKSWRLVKKVPAWADTEPKQEFRCHDLGPRTKNSVLSFSRLKFGVYDAIDNFNME